MTPERARSLVASILPGHQVYESGLDSGAADAPAHANLAAEVTRPALAVLTQLYFKSAPRPPLFPLTLCALLPPAPPCSPASVPCSFRVSFRFFFSFSLLGSRAPT